MATWETCPFPPEVCCGCTIVSLCKNKINKKKKKQTRNNLSMIKTKTNFNKILSFARKYSDQFRENKTKRKPHQPKYIFNK